LEIEHVTQLNPW